MEVRPVTVAGTFNDADTLLVAARKLRAETTGYMEAYSPIPVHGISEILEFKDERLSWFVLLGGLMGAVAGILLQVWVSAIAYPMNVGGRPMISVPAFVPVTFELTILFAAFGAALGMFALNGLPRPHHPIFEHSQFDRVSQDLYLLSIEVDRTGVKTVEDLFMKYGAMSIEVIDEQD